MINPSYNQHYPHIFPIISFFIPFQTLTWSCGLFNESFLPLDPPSFLINSPKEAILDQGLVNVSKVSEDVTFCVCEGISSYSLSLPCSLSSPWSSMYESCSLPLTHEWKALLPKDHQLLLSLSMGFGLFRGSNLKQSFYGS